MLLTFIKLPLVIKIFVLYIYEWPLKTGFAVIFYFRRYNMYLLGQFTAVRTKTLKQKFRVSIMGGSIGVQGVWTPLKNHNNRELLNNSGPDPLKIHKFT